MKMLPRGETLFRKWTIAFTKYHFVEFDVVNTVPPGALNMLMPMIDSNHFFEK